MAAADMEAEIFGGGAGGAKNAAAVDDGLPAEFVTLSADDIARRARLLDNEVRVLRDDATRLNLEQANLSEKVKKEAGEVKKERQRERKTMEADSMCLLVKGANRPFPLDARSLLTLDLSLSKNKKSQIKENKEKIKLNNQLPYLVGNIVEVLDSGEGSDGEEEAEEDGAAADADAGRRGKCVVLKTSTRQTVFLPVVGLVDAEALKPGDLVGVNKDSYLVLVSWL